MERNAKHFRTYLSAPKLHNPTDSKEISYPKGHLDHLGFVTRLQSHRLRLRSILPAIPRNGTSRACSNLLPQRILLHFNVLYICITLYIHTYQYIFIYLYLSICIYMYIFAILISSYHTHQQNISCVGQVSLTSPVLLLLSPQLPIFSTGSANEL